MVKLPLQDLKLKLALVSPYRYNLILNNSFNTKFPCLQHGVRLIFDVVEVMMMKQRPHSRE